MLLHVGFYNYVNTSNVICILDYKIRASKAIVKSAREEKPRSVMDVTRGRKAQSLIVLTGDRYVISAIYTQQLCKRMEGKPVEEEPIKPSSNGKKIKRRVNIDAKDSGPTKEASVPLPVDRDFSPD